MEVRFIILLKKIRIPAVSFGRQKLWLENFILDHGAPPCHCAPLIKMSECGDALMTSKSWGYVLTLSCRERERAHNS